MEIWKDVENFIGLYEVSNIGRIRSKYNKRLRKLSKVPTGYISVCLSKGGKCFTFRVHRLVANAFIPNPHKKDQVNHIDGNKENNNVNNLEWVTQKENMLHAKTNGMITNVKGSKHGSAKINEKSALQIYDLAIKEIYTGSEIASFYKISTATVFQIKNKKAWRHIHKE